MAYSAPSVDARDVLNLKSRHHLIDGKSVIEVSGLVMHSSYVVTSYEVEQIDAAHQKVVLKLTKSKEGYSGSFVVYISLKSPDDVVLFGPKSEVVWPKQ